MKRYLLLITIFTFLSIGSFAQEKKFILIEHFTNTPCSACFAHNPRVYSAIGNYPDDVHHISVHPPIPYSSCIFYQSNPSENEGRAEYYGIVGSPYTVVQGNVVGSSLFTLDAQITERLGDLPEVSIVVAESGNMDRAVSIDVKNLLDVELSGDYTLYVAVVEKEIMYDAPNGQQVHHNVFRRYLNGLDGTAVTFIQETSTKSFDFDFSIDEDWNADEIYVLAYLQNNQTNDILNSGSSLDKLISSDNNLEADDDWSIYPNPAEGIFTVKLPTDAKKISIHTITGKRLYESEALEQADRHKVDSNVLKKGSYFVRIEGANRVYTRKLIKI